MAAASKKISENSLFAELNSDSYVEKISTKDLSINDKYPINSFKLLDTAYGQSLAVVIVVENEPRLYFLPDHIKAKSPMLIKQLHLQKEVVLTSKKFLVYEGKQSIDNGKEMNIFKFVS